MCNCDDKLFVARGNGFKHTLKHFTVMCRNHFNAVTATPWLGSRLVCNRESKYSANRVVRGGSLYYYPEFCRTVNRDKNNTDDCNAGLGFRLVFDED